MRCAFRMSEDNLGAIFLVGDAEHILKQSDPPAVGAFATILRAPVDRLSDLELINFAKQDGATVLDTSGQFRACKVLLRPAAETEADIGADKGARHSSAAKMSAEGRVSGDLRLAGRPDHGVRGRPSGVLVVGRSDCVDRAAHYIRVHYFRVTMEE